MKLILFVEGDTEKKFIKRFIKKWMDPKLKKPIKISTIKFKGDGDLIKEAPKKASKHLNKGSNIGVISLLDLYGPQNNNFYPANKKTPDERYKWGKKYLEDKIKHEKFRHFFAVHELESWLLSEPNIFPPEIEKELTKNKKIKHPETINFNEPPAKFLEKIYRKVYKKTNKKKTYKKIIDGEKLFNKLNPEVAYNKCPKLKEFLDEILNMAKEAET